MLVRTLSRGPKAVTFSITSGASSTCLSKRMNAVRVSGMVYLKMRGLGILVDVVLCERDIVQMRRLPPGRELFSSRTKTGMSLACKGGSSPLTRGQLADR
jgi:hypothetical protein